MRRLIRPRGHLLLVALCGWLASAVQAAPVVIPIELLRDASPDASPDASATPERRLAQLVRAHFDHLGLSIDNGVLFGNFPLEGYQEELVSFCAVPLPKEIQTDPATAQVALDPQGQFVVDVDDLRTITISANLPGHLRVNTPARIIWGQAVPFVGNCEKLNTDHGSLSLDLPFELNFTIALHTVLDYDAANVAVILDKHAVISGDLAYGAGSIDSDFGGISLTDTVISAFERYLLRALTGGGQDKFAEKVQTLNRRLDGLDGSGNRDDNLAPFNGRTVFPLLEDLDDAKTAGALIAQLGLGEILVDTLNRRGGELLMQWASIGADEQTALLDSVAAEAGCQVLTEKFTAPLPRTPLYTLSANACVLAEEPTQAQPFFTDAACTQEVAFRPTNDLEFCSARLARAAKTTLGNGAAWEPVTNQPNDPLPAVRSLPWTAELSTRLNLGVLSVQGAQQPYVKKLAYKSTVTAPGQDTCTLEMRVYKNDIAATGAKPLLALHGGTWRNRGWSFLGLEATVAHFTQRGFIVFVPFYRLAGDSDGPPECRNASWQEITSDVEDALDWVLANGSALGAAPGPVPVFGQSAGAHLAAWLASYRGSDVAQALLFYPPLDFLDFLQGVSIVGGRYEPFSNFGLDALSKLYGARSDTEIDLASIAPLLNDTATTSAAIAAVVPDAAFKLANANLASPPRFLQRCATETGLDLSALDLASPPAALLACLKQDMGEFIADNALIARLRDSRVPVHILHGGADELVPFDQVIKFCNSIDGGDRPVEVTGDAVLADCGPLSKIHVVANANHALDLGLCAGDLCPAGQPGTPTRRAVESAVTEAYAWLNPSVSLTEDSPSAPPAPNAPVQSDDPTSTPSPSQDAAQPTERQQGAGSANGASLFLLLLLIGLGRLNERRPSDKLLRLKP